MLAIERLEAAGERKAGRADGEEARQQTPIRSAFKPPH
jgi:hypothetical protein